MKNISSLITFFLLSHLAFGQIEWVGNHDFSEAATDLVRTSQNQYILVHNGLTVFDSIGNIVFSGLTNDYPDADGGNFSEIVELPDSSIVLSVSFGECDVIIEMLLKFDKNWNEVWREYAFFSQAVGHFSDNSTVFAGWKSSRWLPDGTIAWDTNFTEFQANDLVVLPNDDVLLATTIGMYTMGQDGMLLDSLNNYILDKIELLPDDTYVGFTSNTLYRFAADFLAIGFFQQQGLAFKDIAIGINEMAVLTTSDKVLRLNFDFQSLGTTDLASHNQDFAALSYADNGIVLAGSERFGDDGMQGNNSAFIKHFAWSGNTSQTAEDAALTAVNQEGSLEVENNWGLYSITIPNIKLTVTNEGASTIERLNVNFTWPEAGGFPCPFSNSFSKTFEGFNLLPGASTQLNWGELSIRTWEDFSGEQIELCFWTSLPNHHLETNNDNDGNCMEVLVDTYEPSPIYFTTAFLPNTDMVSFNLNPGEVGKLLGLTIFNATGQIVGQEMAFLGTDYNIAGLPDGLYIFRLNLGKRAGWAKVVKY